MAALLLQCPTQKKVDFCHLNKSPKLLSFYLVPWHYTYKTISPIKRCKESLGNRTDRFSTCWVCWQPPVCRFESCFFCGFFSGLWSSHMRFSWAWAYSPRLPGLMVMLSHAGWKIWGWSSELQALHAAAISRLKSPRWHKDHRSGTQHFKDFN